MHFATFLLSAMAIMGVAATDNCNCPPTKTTSTSTTLKTTTKATSSTIHTTVKPPSTTPKAPSSKTTTSTAPASTNNGQVFLNRCTNLGISIADCTQLLNIAALNGNNINVGGSSTPPGPGSVNNGQKFLNECKNVGISILNCAQLLNLAVLNGNNIDISLAELTNLVKALGLNVGTLTGLLTGSGGLVKVPAGLV